MKSRRLSLVLIKRSSTAKTVKERDKARKEQRTIHTNLGKTKDSATDYKIQLTRVITVLRILSILRAFSKNFFLVILCIYLNIIFIVKNFKGPESLFYINSPLRHKSLINFILCKINNERSKCFRVYPVVEMLRC